MQCYNLKPFSLLICIHFKTQKFQEKYIWKRPLPIRLSHISANIIGIYLQTMRSQMRLLLKEQPNTDPQRSTENSKDNTADVKGNGTVVGA